MDWKTMLQLGVLVLAVPAQYFLTSYMASTQSSRTNALQEVLSSAVNLRNRYFSWQSWHTWCLNLVSDFQSKASAGTDHSDRGQIRDTDRGESTAIEVLNYRNKNGHFATSTDIRNIRGNQVKYRIGQVIRHKQWGYRGVIIGWDPVTKAPESWLKQNHPANKQHWRGMPSYSVLVDTRDRSEKQTTYVAQENIEIAIGVKVIHPDLDDYFQLYDGSQYLPRPWLKKLYPKD